MSPYQLPWYVHQTNGSAVQQQPALPPQVQQQLQQMGVCTNQQHYQQPTVIYIKQGEVQKPKPQPYEAEIRTALAAVNQQAYSPYGNSYYQQQPTIVIVKQQN